MKGFEEVDYFLIDGRGIGGGSGLTGGMMKRMGKAPAPGSPIRGCTLTFEVADVDATYAWALANGGAEALPPTDYPGIGRAAYCEDGEGNIVGLITPVKGT
jgi:predicted enzyme related to lactoylglutathione lyase